MTGAQKMFYTMMLVALAFTAITTAAAESYSSIRVPGLSPRDRYDAYVRALRRLISRRSSGAQVDADLNTCSPPCATGQCCLQTSTNAQATCQSLRLSGQRCVGRNQYTSKNPSKTTAMLREYCPCHLGMACLMSPTASYGACSFFKK